MAASPTNDSIASLRPGTKGHTVVVKVGWHAILLLALEDVRSQILLACCSQVLDSKIVIDRKGAKGVPLKVSECIVGDGTGVVVLIARNDQGRWMGAAGGEKMLIWL